jgi:7,8-dihydropterin-6-yl-methyl-4-(beta-D-ribofuranosyl)aminobenzene 5'-phosphate synthase
MTYFTRLTALGLLLCLSTISAREPGDFITGSPDNAVHVTIIYDNYQVDKRLETDWGFACLVEYQGNKLLFDAGRKADLYRENINLLDIDPQKIPSLFISHEHGDHTAGIPWITEVNPSVKCYLPSTYAAQLKVNDALPPNSKGISKPVHLYGPYYSTGDSFEAFNEQGLIVKTKTGGILVTGCGHPGPVEMVKVAENELGIEIRALIGGLHLLSTPEAGVETIAESLKEMGVQQICPTHCTGDQSIAILKKFFGEGYISGGTGQVIVIH